MSREKLRQRILLGLLGVVALSTLFWGVLSPLMTEASRVSAAIDESRARSQEANRELKRFARDEAQAEQEAPLNVWAEQVLATVPNPFLVRGYEIITAALEAHDLDEAKVHAQNVVPFRGLPEFAIASWGVSVPECQPLALGQAVADLENAFPLGQIAELSLKANDATGTVEANLNFQTVVIP